MLRSIATVSLSGVLLEKLDAASAAGFDGIELFEQDLTTSNLLPEDVRDACEERGLAISLFQPFRDFEGADDKQFARNIERARRKFDLMQRLGTSRILVCSSVAPDTRADDSLITDQLGRLAELAREFGVQAGYEALAWGCHVNRWRHAWRLVNTVNRPELGLVLDSFHIFARGDTTEGVAQLPGERISFVQVADAPRLSMDLLQWSRHHRCFPGQGEFDLVPFTQDAIASGYAGPLSLEVFSDTCRRRPASETATDAYRSLVYLESIAAARDPSVVCERVETRPADAIVGLEFVEFAVTSSTARELGQWLEHSGFAPAGRHHSKAVNLLLQGKTALVLNAQPRSFASRYHSAHGPSACAWAYRASEPQTLLERANRLGYERFEEKRQPKEVRLEGVIGPGGSLHYFLEQTDELLPPYMTDFAFVGRLSDRNCTPSSDGAHVDHIALNVPFDERDSWVLFYRALFGLEPEGRNWAADPYGIVHTVALRNRAGTLRVTLLASDHGRTEVNTALTQYHGAGLNHLALACADLLTTLERLRERGIEMLPVPANYYEDLHARYGDDLPLEKMKRLGVLFDREPGGGELMHAYTRPFLDRFYLELVQRINGYEGYGSANEPVRLAALCRPLTHERFWSDMEPSALARRVEGGQSYPAQPYWHLSARR